MDYIDRIKQLKSEQKMTNDKLSELTGIPLGTLSKILAGISDSPKLFNIMSIADALGVSLDYLVNGIPENTNNYTLSSNEIELVESYRRLDRFGRDLVDVVIAKESERISSLSNRSVAGGSAQNKAKILDLNSSSQRTVGGKRTVLLYDLPVSAGVGVYLDDTDSEEISIPDNERTKVADFALRISGNSMEPKYHNGDIVLVEDTDSIEVGELGIFVMDGNGYFKKFGGDRLISLNPDYGDILLQGYSDIVCCGRVVGRLKKR